jgi:hypothetical protein
MRSGYCYHKTGFTPTSFIFQVQRYEVFPLLPNFSSFFFAKSINLVSFCSPTDYTDFTEMPRNHFQRAAIITSALTKNPMNPKNP